MCLYSVVLQDMYDFLEAVIMRQTAQEEAYRKLDEMAAKLTETLRKSAKMVCNVSSLKIWFVNVMHCYPAVCQLCRGSLGFFLWADDTIQYNTIFVYCEMTERSSTRGKKIQYESLYSMRWMKLLSHSLFTLGISCLLWRLGLRW